MRWFAVTALCTVLLLWGASSYAQTRDPELRAYSFVSELGGGAGLWVNPGAAGFNPTTRLGGYWTFDRPDGESWFTGQYAIGLQLKLLGFGYRHDEFSDPNGFAQGDAYTLALGLARGRDGLGVARVWRSVGPAEGSWEIGYVHHESPGVSVGLVWRDIGSPAVRNTVRREHIVGAVTLHPKVGGFSLSAQADYRTDGGDFRAFRVGGSLALLRILNLLALAQWDGEGDFDGFRIGVVVTQPSATLLGGAGLSSGGDARTATLGGDFESRPQR